MRLNFSNNAKYFCPTEKPKNLASIIFKKPSLQRTLKFNHGTEFGLGARALVSAYEFGDLGILCVRLKKSWLATPWFENSASLRNTNPPSKTNAVPTRKKGSPYRQSRKL